MDKLDINVLAEMLENIRRIRHPDDLKHFHLGNIDNFIYHFGAIRNRKRQKLVYDKLFEYLTLVQSQEEIDEATGRELFDHYLYPVAKNYSISVGFVMVADVGVTAFVWVHLIVLLYIFHASPWVHIAVHTIIFLFITFGFIKRRKRKTYGLYLKN